MTNTTNINWPEIIKAYKRFVSDAIQVINNPQANPQTTILVGSMLLLFAIIIGLLIYLIISSIWGNKQDATNVLTAKHFEVTRREVWGTRIAFLILLFISINGVYYYGSQPSVCRRCHSGDLVSNIKKSTHANVSCLACHRSPGVDGYAAQVFDYMRWLSQYASLKEKNGYDVRVEDSACLRCHAEITKKTVERWGVRARHIDLLQKGDRCVDCHNAVAHGKALAVVKEPSMDKCVDCHNHKKVSADCDFCHTGTAQRVTRRMPEEIIRVETEPMANCRRCHPQTKQSTCIRCHGLELPHPEGWANTGAARLNDHAMQGFLNKELCNRCHQLNSKLSPVIHPIDPVYKDQIFCNRCHSFPSIHGSTERWVKMHGKAASNKPFPANPICSDCHAAENERQCVYCHTKQMCEACHR